MAELIIARSVIDEIISHCREVYPAEACGILAGKAGAVEKIYKMRNIDDSSVTYMADPKEQFSVMKEMRQEGLELVAIYHSHPHADAYPSQQDIKLAFYSDAVYIIVSLINKEPEIKAFTIREGKVEEVEMEIIFK